MFPSQSSPTIVVVSFAISFVFFTVICATATTKTKYLFHGYDLAIISETNQSLSYYNEHGNEVNCNVYPRKLSMTESHEAKPAMVIVSVEEYDPDLPFEISCSHRLYASFEHPITVKCPVGMTPDNDDNCRPIAE